MDIDWNAYYQKESEIIDLSPDNDPSETQRCLAAWAVFPRRVVSTVLDVGCGDGYFCHWLSERANLDRVEGVDISEPRLARARGRYPQIQYSHGQLPQLPFRDNSFDVVTCIEVLEHQDDPDAALRELIRVSSRYVVCTVPDRELRAIRLCPHCLRTYPANGHLHSFDRERITTMAKRAGVKLLELRSYYPPMGASTRSFPRWLGRVLRRLSMLFQPKDGPGSYLASLMVKAGPRSVTDTVIESGSVFPIGA